MKKVAVAVIHGMGRQHKPDGQGSDVPSFSRTMRDRVRSHLGQADFDRAVAWREIYWADVLQPRQDRFFDRIASQTRWPKMRRFVMSSLSDAASYRLPSGQNPDATYALIHRRVRDVVKELRDEVGDKAPVLILAHSLGAHIMSNYIYDLQKGRPVVSVGASDVEQMRTVAAMFTFGANIPVFVFSYPEHMVKPIAYPGAALPDGNRLRPWWINSYSRNDVLGYPLDNFQHHYWI